jgi:hypothetical protein
MPLREGGIDAFVRTDDECGAALMNFISLQSKHFVGPIKSKAMLVVSDSHNQACG